MRRLDTSRKLLRGIVFPPLGFDAALCLLCHQLYFEHATEYGPLLSLKVAQKRSKAGVPSVPMVCEA